MITVLDHGYMKFIESWGSDESIIETARMSTNKGFLGWGPKHSTTCKQTTQELEDSNELCSCGFNTPGDEKLLRYLSENKHDSPFEFAGMIIEVQAPIFVFREWHRHRTQSYNEMSARYTPLPDLNYIPTVERVLLNTGTSNKQASAIANSKSVDELDAKIFISLLQIHYVELESTYQTSLQHGIPKELARLILPVGRYSRMRACANLRNWLAFLTLRNDEKAQWEIRQYAILVEHYLTEKFPRTMELFVEKRKSK